MVKINLGSSEVTTQSSPVTNVEKVKTPKLRVYDYPKNKDFPIYKNIVKNILNLRKIKPRVNKVILKKHENKTILNRASLKIKKTQYSK